MNIVFLEMNEAASFLRVSKSTLYKMVMKRAIPFHKVGKKTIFNKEELAQFVCGNTVIPQNINEFDFLTLPTIR